MGSGARSAEQDTAHLPWCKPGTCRDRHGFDTVNPMAKDDGDGTGERAENTSRRRADAPRAPRPPLRLRGARAAYRCADDADSPRQAPSSLRQQPQRRAREASRPLRAEPRAATAGYRQRAGRHPHGRTEQRGRPSQPLVVLDAHGPRERGRRRDAHRLPQRGNRQNVRRFSQIQGRVRERGRGALRQRLGLARGHGRKARDRQHPQPGQPADGRPDADLGRRRLGARVLPEVPESAAGVHRRVVECGELA